MTPDPDSRAPGRRAGWSLAAAAGAEVALVGWAIAARAPASFIVGQTLLLALVTVALLYRRYVALRRAYERDIARRAAEAQRAELAGELHDVLGHELSLIALRAGALQVNTSGPAAEAAAQVRAQVEQAVVQLHQTMALLSPPDLASTQPPPTEHDLATLVERARSAGAEVSLTGALGPGVPAPLRLTAHRVAQEGLTNATKHSPGAGVDISVRSSAREVEICIETESSDGGGDGGGVGEVGSGLAGLRRRAAALGGELSVTCAGGRHITRARLPLQTPAPAQTMHLPATPSARRPMAATLRSMLVPALVVTAVVLAFYTWSSHDATLEQSGFEALATGQSAAASQAELPDRQARIRLTPAEPAPPGWVCRQYTDGNFPLAMASYEICDDGDVFTRVTDLRGTPLR